MVGSDRQQTDGLVIQARNELLDEVVKMIAGKVT
jgi:hypothetical protein